MRSASDFDRLYADDPDPWQVATSWYERRKIGIVLASLRREHYPVVWDAGCGTGELAAALADRADVVVATDLSGEATALSAARTVTDAGVSVERSRLPARPQTLTGAPDLVILSEVLYYLDDTDRHAAYALVDDIAAPDADLVLVHWGPRADGARRSGLQVFNEAGDALNSRGWGRLVTHVDVEFYLGLFSRDVPTDIGGRDGTPRSDSTP